MRQAQEFSHAPITNVSALVDGKPSKGKRLASASLDQTVILWDLDLDHLKAEACRTANRNLTCDAWQSYISVDEPYRKTCEGLPGPAKCD